MEDFMESRRTRREYVALVVVIAVSLLLVASTAKCNKTVHRSQAEIEIDDAITSKVRQNLTAASPDVRAAHIEITTFKLFVKLEGDVRSEEERNLAIKIASDTEIVKDGTTQKVKQVEAKGLAIKP
jgi:osmotically-inducible protein OsmY